MTNFFKTFRLVFFIIFSQPIFASEMTKMNAYQFSFTSINGETINLSDYKGKVIMIVNTASQCGLTPQYEQLEMIHNLFKDKDFVLIGVPCGDFANQEYDNSQKIKDFTSEEYNITFILTEKNSVKGKNAHPFYEWANKQAGFLGSPKWNFHKYLIDKNGDFAAWYSSTTSPQSVKIINKIEELL